MTPRKAKTIAAEYTTVEFWYDRYIRLWCCTDPLMYAASDYVAPGHLEDWSEKDFRFFIESMVSEFETANEDK